MHGLVGLPTHRVGHYALVWRIGDTLQIDVLRSIKLKITFVNFKNQYSQKIDYIFFQLTLLSILFQWQSEVAPPIVPFLSHYRTFLLNLFVSFTLNICRSTLIINNQSIYQCHTTHYFLMSFRLSAISGVIGLEMVGVIVDYKLVYMSNIGVYKRQKLLTLSLLSCVVSLCFVCLRHMLCVLNVASVSGLSIVGCPFGFL